MKIVVVAVLGLTAVALASPVQAAGSSSGATSDLSATMSIGDIQFDGSECVYVPWSVDWSFVPSSAENASGTVDIELRQPGSSSANSSSAFFYGDEAVVGREQEQILVCPYEYNPAVGPFQVSGALSSSNYSTGAEQKVPLAGLEVNAIQNTTSLSPVKVKKSRYGYTLSGTATATTITRGTVGAGGVINVEVQKPKSKKWTGGLQTYPDSFGNWSVSAGKLAKGTKIRVSLDDCKWCTDATRSASVKR